MMVSTKGRYALRVMLDLASNGTGDYIPLKDIADREEISQKYLESIMTILSKAGLVDARHGKSGGYRLNRPVQKYSVGEILQLTEGSLAPVSCLEEGSEPCPRALRCKTLPLWSELNQVIYGFLNDYPLSRLVDNP